MLKIKCDSNNFQSSRDPARRPDQSWSAAVAEETAVIPDVPVSRI
jgi:hypothetical protein